MLFKATTSDESVYINGNVKSIFYEDVDKISMLLKMSENLRKLYIFIKKHNFTHITLRIEK